MEGKFRLSLAVVLVLILGNLVFLDWKVLKREQETVGRAYLPETEKIVEKKVGTKPEIVFSESCPISCLLAIKAATASGGISEVVPSSAPIVRVSTGEIYVPLGRGKAQGNTWQDIEGAEAYIDTEKYGGIKEARFEATLSVLNGRVYARLINKTNDYIVWFSEVSSGGSSPKRVESLPITLYSGNKLYRVQLKTDLDYEGILDMARIKIVLE
jgi:hypothetical protein